MDKDPNNTPRTRRTMKFAPKKPKPQTAKIEADVEEDEEHSAEIQARIRRLKASDERQKPKVEKQSSVQVAFPGGSSLSPRTVRSGGPSGKSSGSGSKFSANDKNVSTHSSTAIVDQSDASMIEDTDDIIGEKDYKEPWPLDSNYPVTLPLRKPNSGNPEILNEKEFGEAATNVEYNDQNLNPAEELELLDNSEYRKILFFQLPVMPCVKPPESIKGKEKIGTSKSSPKLKKLVNFSDLPSGSVGKMLVYKSGAVKFKVGETLFDVSPGTKTSFDQHVVAMNTAKKHCSVIGEVAVNTAAVVTPDIDSIDFDSIDFCSFGGSS